MELIDVILFPLYVLLFHLIFSWQRKRIKDPLLKKYHKQGFWIKVFGALCFSIFHGIISPGNDSISLYYDEGIHITKLILEDLSNIQLIFSPGADFDQSLLFNPYNKGYFGSESNYFVVRLVAIFSFVCFRNYTVMNLVFSMISFTGVWQLYKFFYEQYPQLHKKLAIAIIYFPTFVFWSSGILKDPLCTGMLGWMTYSLYNVFCKRQSILKNGLIAIASGYILAIVKSYILFAYLPFFFSFLVLINFKRIETTGIKILAFAGLLIVIPVGFYIVSDKLEKELGAFALSKLTESVKMQQAAFINMADAAESSFSLGVEFDGSNLSLIKMAPAGIIATFFRPYLWESKKLSTLLSSLESLLLMAFTLLVFIKAGPFNFIKFLLKDPMILYCFLFALVFALFVGTTTLNFGTLVRYKIPCMPFFIIALVLINERSKKQKSEKAVALSLLPLSGEK